MQLRDHLADLAVAARASGLRCDMLRGTIAQAGEAAALKELQGFTRSEKESLRLLRQARARITADARSEPQRAPAHLPPLYPNGFVSAPY